MAKVKDFYEYLNNSIADFGTQEDWDNSGMLVGSLNDEVKKVAVALDITNETIEPAKQVGANLIISHHPVIFSGQKKFVDGNPAYELAKNSMNAICCHTPLDIADGGTNDTLADILGFDVFRKDDPILRYAEIEETTAEKLAKHIAEKLKANIRCADGKKPIKKIAICTGAGCSLIEQAGDIDAFITGDASYHNFLDCAQAGITLIAAGHFETENPVVPVLVEKLSKEFAEIEIFGLNQENPVRYY